jgi:hypothetical protein
MKPEFGGKEGNKMKKTTETIMEREMLQASVGPDVYEELKVAWQEESKSLQESLEDWKEPEGGLLYAVTTETAELIKLMPLQSSLTEIPFRDESKGDKTSSVASSGCAIIVAKFLERYFDSDKRVSVELLAKLAVDFGYRGYKKQEDGTWRKMGMNHLWFDKFVPRYFVLKSQRVSDIKQVLEALKTRKVPVLLVKNSVYKQDPKNTDSHFVCLLGIDKHGYHIYDPESSKIVRCEFERIHKSVRIGWIISK